MQNLLNPQNSLDLEHFMLLAELNISQKKFNVALVFYECALYICTDILNHIDNVINSIETNSNHNRNHIDTLMQRYVLIKLYVNCKLANIFLQHTDTTIYSIDYLIECINKTVSHIDMDSDLLIYGFYASMTLSEFYIIENKYGEASDCILLIYNLPNVNIPEIKMILTSKLYKISYLTQNVDNCCYWISNGVKFAKTLESNDIILNYFYLLSIMTTIIFYSTNILDKLIDDFSNGSYLEFTPCFINSQDYSLIIFHYLIKAIHIYYKGNMTKLGKILTILYSALANFRNSKHRNQYISWMTLPEIYSNVSLVS
ncbi:hypothetical protein A3Q56_01889 [Intoshia linei]|uniref:Uncharacterized protein n=1 Tax=Intoshia linei TaxID=1819745 RepID=A0A177B7V6_9BILA|nr:hypothetical protein A3Q56_01889 [Intoshia linei]